MTLAMVGGIVLGSGVIASASIGPAGCDTNNVRLTLTKSPAGAVNEGDTIICTVRITNDPTSGSGLVTCDAAINSLILTEPAADGTATGTQINLLPLPSSPYPSGCYAGGVLSLPADGSCDTTFQAQSYTVNTSPGVTSVTAAADGSGVLHDATPDDALSIHKAVTNSVLLAPSIATTSSPTGGSVVPGTAASDTVTVSGPAGGPTPTGTVTFYLCDPSQTGTTPGCSTTTGTQVGSPVALAGGAATSTPAYTNTDAIGAYCWAVAYSGDGFYNSADLNVGTNSDVECFTTATQAVFGFTPGFLGNKNGNALITSAGLLPVSLGGNTRGIAVTNLADSNTILRHGGCTLGSLDCESDGLSKNLTPHTLDTLLMQTLALTYNIDGVSGFAGDTIASHNCTSCLTPALQALGLTPSSTVSQVLAVANELINDSTSAGTTTQQQAGAMNALLGDCLNQEG